MEQERIITISGNPYVKYEEGYEYKTVICDNNHTKEDYLKDGYDVLVTTRYVENNITKTKLLIRWKK